MCTYEFKGINSFLIGMAQELLAKGVERNARGSITYELPYPVIIKISNPTARLVTIQERKWDCFLPFAESLWLATGRNDMSFIRNYLSRMDKFSDNTKTMRAGYGPRLRHFSGFSQDYNIDSFRKQKAVENNLISEVDQFDFVIKTFNKDTNTRQGVISITDPPKDCFDTDRNLKETKDFPCTKGLHFQKIGGKLDLIVHMRSNDFLWGASGVNIFNYTFIQEYFSQMLDLEIGSYYHIVDNFHFYQNKRKKLEAIANAQTKKDEGFLYKKKFSTLEEFDTQLNKLTQFEGNIRLEKTDKLEEFDDDFFNDWAKMFYLKKFPLANFYRFSNPTLQNIQEQSRFENRGNKLAESISENKTIINQKLNETK